jgi:phosphatidate cytidylyltransferase
MKQRVISGAVLVVILALVLYFGGAVTWAFMLLVSLIGNMELLRVYQVHDKLAGALCYLATIVYYAIIYFDKTQFILPLIVIYLLLILAVYVITFPRYTDRQITGAFLDFVYVSVMLSFVYLIRDMKHGLVLVLLIFVSSWINDTCAYFVGRALGKHKMAPVLSPKKSVEGLIGGIVGAGVFGGIYGLLFNSFVESISYAPLIFALVGALGAIPAVIGDLAASAIKRNNDIKDYGKLIPGHGGILDRFDSIIFTAPIIYYLLTFLL